MSSAYPTTDSNGVAWTVLMSLLKSIIIHSFIHSSFLVFYHHQLLFVVFVEKVIYYYSFVMSIEVFVGDVVDLP